MRIFLGVKQKKTDRLLNDWIKSLSKAEAKRMNIKKDSFDLSTGNIKNHFGNYFKPNK